ncbi:MAG: hypothetical protein VYC47_05130, partial [Verrucomicrobiota bacterium]|nr:hypothetical protein [Verrucomicrobiota bacterium]
LDSGILTKRLANPECHSHSPNQAQRHWIEKKRSHGSPGLSLVILGIQPFIVSGRKNSRLAKRLA